MTVSVYYIICATLSVTVLIGIVLMSKVKTAVSGNLLSSLATAMAIITTLIYFNIFPEKTLMYIIFVCIGIGSFIGLTLARKVKMIQMPQLVAVLNGVGGAASALVGGAALFSTTTAFNLSTAVIALIVGTLTLTGSLIAAGKLATVIEGKPVIWKGHQVWTTGSIFILIVIVIITILKSTSLMTVVLIGVPVSAFLGVAFSIRVGGADMPITISLLNSLSGVAGAIAGMAIGDIVLVSIGGIVGASGLLLTKIMCKSMNSSLLKILQGKTSTGKRDVPELIKIRDIPSLVNKNNTVTEEIIPSEVLRKAKNVIIVPGYGMALAQAQHLVKQLSDILEKNGTEVKYAIHPVAGRMPGHMNVLLCEADVSYDQLYEMDDVNDEFCSCDACVVVGANDVLNPAAREAEGTPIYGMPILSVDKAKHIIFCNYDLKPGYAGVENPLYTRNEGVSLLLGDASETLQKLLKELDC